MEKLQDSFDVVPLEGLTNDVERMSRSSVRPARAATGHATIVRFCGFDVDDRPLVGGLLDAPHQIVVAHTTVPLSRSNIGAKVLVLFEGGDAGRPIVVGVLQEHRPTSKTDSGQPVSVQVDDDRLVLSAEREIILRCGDASITLTRAGKVIIKGSYILSRSSGYNKIKGAAVDIN